MNFSKTQNCITGNGTNIKKQGLIGEAEIRQRSPVLGNQDNNISGITGTYTPHEFKLIFKGKELKYNSARAVMLNLFELLHKEDDTFFERFASIKHGKKRRYLARNKHELYPGRMDLAEDQSVEIIPGWWMGTNYSHRTIKQIINLGLEVAGPRISSLVEVTIK